MKVLPQLPLLALIALLPLASSNFITDGLQWGLQAIAHPIAQAVVGVGSSQCGLIRKMTGSDDDNEKFQNNLLEDLELSFISAEYSVSFKLTFLAEYLNKYADASKCTMLKVFMHGFTDNPDKGNYKLVNEAYSSKGFICVLALDASPYIGSNYLDSVGFVRLLGNRVGQALADLCQKKKFTPGRIHLVGHSLGAHICGHAAKYYTLMTGEKLARVTGLDPAGPCFTAVAPNMRLNSMDAEFVDVIHSNSGVLGLGDALGHADFYPNGGSQQPKCYSDVCNHGFSVQLFAESIHNDSFPAMRCNDYNEFKKGWCSGEVRLMGEGASPDTRGNYYLSTAGVPPYSLGQDGASHQNY